MIGLVGSLSRDRFPDRPGFSVGGGAYHGARAVRRLATDAVVATQCARDDRDALLPPLLALGVPVRCETVEQTATFAIAYEGDERRMVLEALGDPWSVEDARGWVADTLASVAWVHVAPLARSDFDADTLAALARGDIPLSLDGQGLVRAARIGPLQLDAAFDPRLLDHVTMLKLSVEEAAVLGDPGSLPPREVIVTRGSRGATVHLDGRAEDVRADPVDTDPTGAGDAFCVAYADARAGGAEPMEAARRATDLVGELLRA